MRILEVVNEQAMSPVQFVNEGLAPGYKNKQHALSQVAYHFRVLEKAGCIELAEIHQRRGASEHVYRGRSPVLFTDEEFERMSLDERAQLTRTSIRGLMARTDGAIASGTFDGRTDRHLSWLAMELDERGWKELMTALSGCYGEIDRIRKDAQDRLAGSGDEVIPATAGLLGFESPPRPMRY
ncbi:MAG TPA: hypothetical protein VFJ65_11760 [Solirubrobacterales bacterium]|nr:hypothetical protein [Solirubrobacterales bacterium]